jgi:tripartite-type tricarboxylate transporter receptor subunit TctC
LLGGHVQATFSPLHESIETIRAGKVRPLAVTTAMRAQTLPDLPSVSDFVPDYEASSCFGLGAPKYTPPQIVERLNSVINAGLADATIKERLGTADPANSGTRRSKKSNFYFSTRPL